MKLEATSFSRHRPSLLPGDVLFPMLLACVGCGGTSTSATIDDASADTDAVDAPSLEGGPEARAVWSEAGAVFLADGPIRGWVGGTCATNDDCSSSPAAVENAKFGCLNEVYCLEGVCHGDCTIECVQVRADINPCPAPRICTALPGSGSETICLITPIPCITVATCPLYLPSTPDGGVGQWSCVDGTCRYPGFDYPTE
jgi:hypothetical protein